MTPYNAEPNPLEHIAPGPQKAALYSEGAAPGIRATEQARGPSLLPRIHRSPCEPNAHAPSSAESTVE